MIEYKKKDVVMTRGLAITSMVVLHLFCRQGQDVYGTPLIWLNQTTPFVYLFGFFAEICVPLYSICVGYAQQFLYENDKVSYRDKGRRILRLLINYWTILFLFSVLGVIFDRDGAMPGSIIDFIASIFLLHSYNGSWWYLNTYIIVLLMPSKLLLAPVRRIKARTVLFFSIVVFMVCYFIGYFNLVFLISPKNPICIFICKEINNFINILPYVWVGAFICKGKFISTIGNWFQKKVEVHLQKGVLMITTVLIFVLVNFIHRAIVIGPVAVVVFFMFNIWQKNSIIEKVFYFLGKHSINIWLTHMFFYLYIFEGMIFIVRYPLFILLFLILLCIAISYAVMAIEKAIYVGIDKVKSCHCKMEV